MRTAAGLLFFFNYLYAAAQSAPTSFFRIYEGFTYSRGFTSVQQTSDRGYIAIGTANSKPTATSSF